MSTEAALRFKAGKAHQIPESFEGEPKDVLTTIVHDKSVTLEEQSGWTIKGNPFSKNRWRSKRLSRLSKTMHPIAGREQAMTAVRAWIALALALAGALALWLSPAASAARSSTYRIQRLCHAPRPGAAACLGLKLVPASLTPSDLHSGAIAQAGEAAGGARPAVRYKSPWPGYLTPERLHAAYSLPTETAASSLQTIAVVDAYDDPTAEADLGVYDKQFGLPECTTANGCFAKINQVGKASPLPAKEGEWASEISIDLQMAHAICQSCRVLLVEADSEEFTDLGAAVNAAVAAGATEISNSYGGPEQASYTGYATSYYNHPGVLITASSGDCGYLDQACLEEAGAAEFPASSADVLAVGGTTLTEAKKTWASTVWEEGGSGCSLAFTAPLWQSGLANFSATGCGSGRAVADVAAIGDPETGVDIYDSTPEGNGGPTGWGVWGGTSVASPIIAAELALDGGSHNVSYPAQTLYSHLGESDALYDVVSGSNGTCAGASICQAGAGYDGPSGIGSPIGLDAFSIPGSPVSTSPPTVAGVAEQGQTLTLNAGGWTNSPTSISDQWEHCNSAGWGCAAIAGASGHTYTLTAGDVGFTIRVQQTASNASGTGAPAASSQTATVVSEVPTIEGFTPASTLTGASVRIEGTALNGATVVQFGALSAKFKVISPTQIEATVPDGARAGKISLSTPFGTATSAGKFTPSFSLTSFKPTTAKPGKLVTIRGAGFNSSSRVSFGGVPAAGVTYLSSTKLKATVPTGAGTAAISVTNTAAPTGTVSSASSFTAG